MAEHKEGLFRRILNKFLRPKPGETVPPPMPPPEPVTRHHQDRNRDEETPPPSDAVQLEKLQANVASINEIIKLPISARSLAKQEGLKNLVADIVLTPQIDNYHNIDWLTKQRGKWDAIDTTLVEVKDELAFNQIKRNLDNLIEKYTQGDVRISEKHKQAQQVKVGGGEEELKELNNLLSEEGNLPQMQGMSELKQRIVEAINEGPPADYQSQQRQISHYEQIASQIQKLRDENLKTKVKTKDPEELEKIIKNEEQLNQLLSKFAAMVVHSKGLEGELIPGQDLETVKTEILNNPEHRDYIFYHILENLIYNARAVDSRQLIPFEASRKLETFFGILGGARDSKGNNIGKKLVGHYEKLRNIIEKAHDMDFYAAHPQQDMEGFINSTAFFTNTYIDFGFQNPMVALGKRLYEQALLQIREDHNGYIPREYLEWTTGHGGIKLDERVETLLRQAIENGQLFKTPIDPITQLPKLDIAKRMKQGGKDERDRIDMNALYGGEPPGSQSWRRALGDLLISSALKQSKGLALVDMRFLEIISRSKGTSSMMKVRKEGDHYNFSGPGFGSIPYEGIARHIEPIIHYFTRFPTGIPKINAFFSQYITDNPFFKPQDIIEMMRLQSNGKQKEMEEKFGKEVTTRLFSMDNPFSFSGMWGNYTGWRVAGSTMGWDDWKKERLSTANKLSLVGDRFVRRGLGEDHGWSHGNTRNIKADAWSKTENYFNREDDKYTGSEGKTAKEYYKDLREEYRQFLKSSSDVTSIRTADNEIEFEKQWLNQGLKEVDPSTGISYQKRLEDHFKDVKKRNRGVDFDHHMEEMAQKLERGYKSRIWIQAAMRNPLVVAREWEVDWKASGGFERKDSPLRKKIIKEILPNIDLDRVGREGQTTKEEMAMLDQVTRLEGALSSVREIALRENRDLTESDFETIGKENPNQTESEKIANLALRKNALRYWEMVKEEMLGRDESGKMRTAEEWYKELGIEDAEPNDDIKKYMKDHDIHDISDDMFEGLRKHKISWEQIEKIDIDVHHRGRGRKKEDGSYETFSILDHGHGLKSNLLNSWVVDRDWRYLFSTEDMGWEYLSVTELGERNPVRRAGDLKAHVDFNAGLDTLFMDIIKPHFVEEEFHKTMWQMWKAMSADDGNQAYDSCGRIFNSTMKMYKKASYEFGKIPIIGYAATKIAGFVKPMSLMQILAGGPNYADAFTPQDIFRNIHEAEGAEYLQSSCVNPLTGEKDFWTEWDAHSEEKSLGATKDAVMFEAGNEVFWMLLILIIYQAFKQANADNAEGGNGGPRH